MRKPTVAGFGEIDVHPGKNPCVPPPSYGWEARVAIRRTALYSGRAASRIYLSGVKNRTELRKIKREIAGLEKKLSELKARKKELEP
jgi:hypothetical protein